MALAGRTSRVLGIVIGIVIAGAGIAAVIFIKGGPKDEKPPLPVRPLKTLVVGEAAPPRIWRYEGRVKAFQEVDLAFQVAGPLVELPVKKGQEVKKGDLLARIDPRDFQNELDAAEAAFDQAKAHVDRIRKAVKTGAVSRTDLSNAEAGFRVAEAKKRIATKALADTYMKAMFSGRVADTFVENFENVQAKQPILSLQDISSVEIEASVPQERVSEGKGSAAGSRFVAVFDFPQLRGREFDVTVSEFALEADPKTQTYLASFAMSSPEDVSILPGMNATIVEKPGASSIRSVDGGFAVPLDLAPIDGRGTYYVWTVTSNADGKTMTVKRTDVTVGKLTGDHVVVTGGLKKGDRIAAAGVQLLKDGQQVRPLAEKEGDKAK
jgi:RND family efflux transporter MFP subunit